MSQDLPPVISLVPTRRAVNKAEMLAMLKDWTERVEHDEVSGLAVMGINVGTTAHTHTWSAYDKVLLVAALELLKWTVCKNLLDEGEPHPVSGAG